MQTYKKHLYKKTYMTIWSVGNYLLILYKH